MGRPKLWLDTETRCEREIKRGTFQYAEACSIDIFSWAIDGAPVQSVDLQTCPAGDVSMIRDLLHEAEILIAWNSMFDRNVLALGNLKIVTPVEKWRCAMVHAMAHALPGSLEKVGALMGLPEDHQKMKEGKALMRLFCKPRPRNSKLRWATAETHPEQRAQYVAYCDRDVIALRDIARRLPTWNMAWDYPQEGEEWTPAHQELSHYHTDQRMNARGYAIDGALVKAALRAVDEEQARLREHCTKMTDGQVTAATQRDKLLEYVLLEYGVILQDLRGSTLDRVMEDPDLPDGLQELLRVRLAASTTSTAKYRALDLGVSADGRLRGTIQMNGAGRTRRAAGRTFQPQNLPSRGLLPHAEVDLGIRAMKAGGEAMIFDDVMLLASSAIRGCIVAPHKRKIIVADLSNIEGRGLVWLAKEEWKLQAFRDFDAGTGPDLYKLAYSKSFGMRPEDVTKDQRSIGKVQELACGYGGSIGAFMTFSLNYGIDLDEMADKALPTLPLEAIQHAEELLAWFRQKKIGTPGLRHQTLVAILCMVYGWRNAHPNVVALWKGMEDIARRAIQRPDMTFEYGRFKARRSGAWLRILLPSGRSLVYPHPQVDEAGKISYMGVDQYTRQWKRIYTYGGKLVENCIAGGMEALTEIGWKPIETVGSERVWDGVEWVEHTGVKYQNEQPVAPVFGVLMTADHRVLTRKGWRRASSCKGHYRAPCRLPDGYELRGVGRYEIPMERGVRLRKSGDPRGFGTQETGEARNHGLVRLHAACDDSREADNAWNVPPSGFRSVAQHAGSVPTADPSSLGKLRRAWHRCLRPLGHLREFLGGHGADLQEGPDPGAEGQQPRLRPGELPMGDVPQANEQHPPKHVSENYAGGHVSEPSGPALQAGVYHAAKPSEGWLAERAVARPCFDITNCGPRKRFMVRGADGQPLIVHNCTQSFARDILYDAHPWIEAEGYELVLHVHDECITEADDDVTHNHAELAKIMARPPSWKKNGRDSYAPDLPLAAAGFQDYRYRKD